MPNWAGGAAEWAKGHKPQAALIAAGLLVVVFFMFSGGGGPEQSQQGQGEDDLFGAGALPQDVTTVSALDAMQRRMESLELSLRQQGEADAKLAQALDHQKNMLETQVRTLESTYTGQLEAAL